MHGTIGFESELGRGSTFWVQFPTYIDVRSVEAVQPVEEAAGSVLPQVLHIEDDQDLTNVLIEALRHRAEVASATTLADAEALLATREYDMVVIDVILPDG